MLCLGALVCVALTVKLCYLSFLLFFILKISLSNYTYGVVFNHGIIHYYKGPQQCNVSSQPA